MVLGQQSRTQADLSDMLESVARAFESSTTSADTQDQVTAQAIHAIPGVEFASISVGHPDGLMESVAATDAIAARCDVLQSVHDEGPCLDAARLSTTVVTGDLGGDSRWPSYGPAAAELGIRSQLATEIFTTGRNLLALNLFSIRTDAFGASVHAAKLFASQAGAALGFAERVDQREEAMLTRGIIGQAIGITMERYKVDETRALAFLVRVARSSNTKLSIVASQLVDGSNHRSDPSPGV